MDLYVRFKGLCLFQADGAGPNEKVQVLLVDATGGRSNLDGSDRDPHHPYLVEVDPRNSHNNQAHAIRGALTFGFTRADGAALPPLERFHMDHLASTTEARRGAALDPANKPVARISLETGRLEPHLMVRPAVADKAIVIRNSDDGHGQEIRRDQLAYEMIWHVPELSEVRIESDGYRAVWNAGETECVDLVVGNLCNEDPERWGEFVFWDHCTGGERWKDMDFRVYYDLFRNIGSGPLPYPEVGDVSDPRPEVCAGPGFDPRYRLSCANVLKRADGVPVIPQAVTALGAPTCLNASGGQI
jgi:hypothetical protein